MTFETRDVSETSLLVEFPGRSDSEANRAAVSLAEKLFRRRPRGILDAIPGARTLFVLFDPRSRGSTPIARMLRRLGAQGEIPLGGSRLLRIPVAYGGDSGPDLFALARDRNMDPAELCRRHSGAEYRVAFLGFSPGFAYLTGLPRELVAPRLESPRPRVAAGSVAIAGDYSAIYPSDTPGGWRIIGRSPVSLFDPTADPPALLSPGDRVAFEPIEEDELLRGLEQRRARETREAPVEHDPIFEIVAPGAFTSVQGAPRFGLGRSGVPAGGPMDPGALAAGNALVGNERGAAGLEVTSSGLELAVLSDAVLGLAGADVAATRNGDALPLGEAFRAEAGDRLSFGRGRAGVRAYLCVAGGLTERRAAETTRRLVRGDRVGRARRVETPGLRRSAAVLRPPVEGVLLLRVLPGPQADVLGAGSVERFFSAIYRVSPESDRRGIRLDGPALDLLGSPDIAPEGTALGAVQVPGNGLPIVLGPDRPVTGGYAKVATVTARDWPLLAQAPPGTPIRFQATTLPEAVEELSRTGAG